MPEKEQKCRLQKVMADAGIASRRNCEEMILTGQVKVNGKVVHDLPVFVDPIHDSIVVSGRKLRFEPRVYYLLNKPKKVVCTNYDPDQRKKAIDLLNGVKYRVFPVGRLDTDSRGLILMTNDGELANHITHPRYGVPKTYIVEVSGWVTGDEVDKLKKGIHLEHGPASMESIKIVNRNSKRTDLEIVLREGQNRQIRRMLARLGHSVHQLTRVRMGPLTLRGLSPGKYRALTPKEVTSLKKLTQNKKKQNKSKNTWI
ncbi:MAG: rRNA pseudouridine synthase [Sedimentisphaerales bacterium]|nr:rRNA pseudouridine synthase [Sedimentisphaerales bacterium]